jgi:PHD/YefM family antitoxin component YafN of YafNO toxin-antitoxin module
MKKMQFRVATAPIRREFGRSNGSTVVFTDKGKAIAAMVPLSDKNIDAESLALSNNPKFLAIIRRSMREFEKGDFLTLDELRDRLGMRPKPRRKAAGA